MFRICSIQLSKTVKLHSFKLWAAIQAGLGVWVAVEKNTQSFSESMWDQAHFVVQFDIFLTHSFISPINYFHFLFGQRHILFGVFSLSIRIFFIRYANLINWEFAALRRLLLLLRILLLKIFYNLKSRILFLFRFTMNEWTNERSNEFNTIEYTDSK